MKASPKAAPKTRSAAYTDSETANANSFLLLEYKGFYVQGRIIDLWPLQDRSLRAVLFKSVAVASVYPQAVPVLIQQKYALPFRPGTCSNNHGTIYCAACFSSRMKNS